MIIPEQVKCDQCGALKGETNHWWTVFLDRVTSEFYVQVFGKCARPPFDAHGSTRFGFDERHLCGAQCLHTELNAFLSGSNEGNNAS